MDSIACAITSNDPFEKCLAMIQGSLITFELKHGFLLETGHALIDDIKEHIKNILLLLFLTHTLPFVFNQSLCKTPPLLELRAISHKSRQADMKNKGMLFCFFWQMSEV